MTCELPPTHARLEGEGVRRAVLVGINAYKQQPLQGCLNDIAAVQGFLQSERGFAPAHIRVLRNAEATRGAILRELRALAQSSRAGDQAVFYFCGHGAQFPSRDPREADMLDEALCPVDFDWTADSAILDDELAQIFDSLPPGVATTWVIDACHSGDLHEHLDRRIAACRAMSAPSPLGPSLGPSTARATRIVPGERCLFLTACASTERAADIFVEGMPRGAFTYHLLAAARRAPTASSAELLTQVQQVLAEIGQHPEGVGPGLSAPFLLPPECSMMQPKTPRTVRLPDRTSLEADRHLHMYLAEAARKAVDDAQFGSRLLELGVDLSAISVADASAMARAVRSCPRSGAVTCRSFWWGFHLEVPPMELAQLPSVGALHQHLMELIGTAPRRAAPHLQAMVTYVVENLAEVQAQDRGAGVFISMSSFAPDLFVATAVPAKPMARRGTDPDAVALSL